MSSRPIQVSASILCADFNHLADEIRKCEDAGVDMLHFDVMDGHFVPNISIGHCIMEAIRPITKLPIETHLMIENPWMYIDDFAERGADIISIHTECYGPRRAHCREIQQYPKEVDSMDGERARQDIQKIRDKGARAFMVVNPGTPVAVLNPVLKDLDGVLMMSVNPGFSRQAFKSEVLDKIRDLRSRFDGDITIDGGVKADTAPEAVKVGVNILATASYFFGAKNPVEAVQYMKNLGRSTV